MGANNGALHTTWRNPGAGVGGASVDIGDPGLDEGDADRAASIQCTIIKTKINSHSSNGVQIGSVGGTWVRSTGCTPVRGDLGEVGSRRG